MKIRLMSYNVLHFENIKTGKIDYDAFADEIKAQGADIIGLNEIYTGQEKELAKRLGFYSYFSFGYIEDGVPFGNGIVSRFPLENCRTVAVPDPEIKKYSGYYEPRCVLCCEVNAGGAVLNINVTHFGLNPDEQENALKKIIPLIDCENYVLMGDFNQEPGDENIRFFRENLTDSADYFAGERLSFPSDKPDRRIDYIFTGDDIKVLSSDIPDFVISDHRAVVAEIETGCARN